MDNSTPHNKLYIFFLRFKFVNEYDWIEIKLSYWNSSSNFPFNRKLKVFSLYFLKILTLIAKLQLTYNQILSIFYKFNFYEIFSM